MVSTVERRPFFSFAQPVDHRLQPTGSSNGCRPFNDYDELFLPSSRSNSFASFGSSTSSHRRSGIVGEHQLESLQRRLFNHVQTSSPSSHDDELRRGPDRPVERQSNGSVTTGSPGAERLRSSPTAYAGRQPANTVDRGHQPSMTTTTGGVVFGGSWTTSGDPVRRQHDPPTKTGRTTASPLLNHCSADQKKKNGVVWPGWFRNETK